MGWMGWDDASFVSQQSIGESFICHGTSRVKERRMAGKRCERCSVDTMSGDVLCHGEVFIIWKKEIRYEGMHIVTQIRLPYPTNILPHAITSRILLTKPHLPHRRTKESTRSARIRVRYLDSRV